MQIRFIFLCWLCIGTVWQSSGQQDTSKLLHNNKQFIFWNISNYLDPSGHSLQLGYNRQVNRWMDVQMELGFVSDDFLLNARLPFDEYVGFRIRPQIKFLRIKTLHEANRFYGGLMVSYQRLKFRENKNFLIDNSFNRNITFGGRDETFAWYLTGGIDTRSSNRFVFSTSIGIGQVHVRTTILEGNIPEDARLIRDCLFFCGRSEYLDFVNTRLGFIFDVKIGYLF